jgi:hypothetical protein
MSRLIKILHIDPDYRITYFIFRSRLNIRSSVPLQTAIELLKNEDFDLIVSEPHNKAILKEQHHSINKSSPIISNDQLIMERTPIEKVNNSISLHFQNPEKIGWRSW